MNKTGSGRIAVATETTALPIPLQNSAAAAPGANRQQPQMREAEQAPQGQRLIDAYGPPSSSSQTSGAYAPPGAERISAALEQASASVLENLLRAAAGNHDHATIKQIGAAANKLPKDAEPQRAALRQAVDSRDASGDSVLMTMLKNRPAESLAQSRHDLALIELLLIGPDRQLTDRDGSNAAMIAIKHKSSLSTIRLLLEDGKLDHADQAGDTALMTAVALKNEGLVELLLERGASASFKAAGNGESALERALSDTDYDNDSIKQMLRRAAPRDQAAVIAPQRSTNASPEQRAFRAAGQGDRKTLEKLLEEQPSLVKAKNGAGHTLMMQAAIHGELDIARLLLGKGARRNETGPSGYTAVLYAIRHGHTQVANFLIEEGAQFDRAGKRAKSALPYAALKGQASVVANLLGHEADPDAQLNHGSLLQCAFQSGSQETMQVVLLHLSASRGGRSTLDRELRSCIYSGLISSDGKDLAHAELLLDAGADADSVRGAFEEGTTSLMFLAEHCVDARFAGGLQMAKLLIERGADSERKNKNGKTALDIARDEHGYQAMIDLLSAKAATPAAS